MDNGDKISSVNGEIIDCSVIQSALYNSLKNDYGWQGEFTVNMSPSLAFDGMEGWAAAQINPGWQIPAGSNYNVELGKKLAAAINSNASGNKYQEYELCEIKVYTSQLADGTLLAQGNYTFGNYEK